MPAYEITVSAPVPNTAEPLSARLKVLGPYDQVRAKAEALRLAKALPAFAKADWSKATAVVDLRMSTDDYVAARRSR